MTGAAHDTPEQVLGKYHIVKPLKIGGTAAIYLAIMRGENNFSREVVIKRPLPHLVADQRSRLMFIDEAHIAARLSHPNICQVLDLVSRDDEVYLVLEYLRGVDVREILKRCIQLGRLPSPEVAVWIAIEMAAGLDFAHEAVGLDGKPLNLVHRDVSPKNIRVTYAGSVKVIDFGIARAMNRATETAAGTIKGTLGYMSPEQILGDDIDRRSDIFAYGICLFQMLTCRNPFDGPTLKERVRRLTQAPIPSIREFNPTLDDEIADIVKRCLERDPTDRYQRIRDVQIDLDRYLAKLQVVSPRQRLIQFLEEIFPAFNEEDTALKSAFSEIHSAPGKIDTEQRLRFPDDPPTEETRRPASAMSTPATAATDERAAVTAATQAGDTEADGYFSKATNQLPNEKATAPTLHEEQGSETRATVLAADSAPERRQWMLMGAIGFALAAIVALVVSVWPRGTTVEPLPEVPKPLAMVDPPPAKTRDASVATAPPPPAKAPPVAPPKKVGPRPPPPPPRTTTSNRRKAEMYFMTARRMEKRGRPDDATLLYHLAYGVSGKRVDPAIYLNLGLLHNRGKDVPKAKACFSAFLARSPDDPAAPRVRSLVSTFPPTKTVRCVEKSEARAARRQYQRRGATIDGWVDETLKRRLK